MCMEVYRAGGTVGCSSFGQTIISNPVVLHMWKHCDLASHDSLTPRLASVVPKSTHHAQCFVWVLVWV